MNLFDEAVQAIHDIPDLEPHEISGFRNMETAMHQLALAQAKFLEMVMKHRAGQFIQVGVKTTDAGILSMYNALEIRQDAILGKRIE